MKLLKVMAIFSSALFFSAPSFSDSLIVHKGVIFSLSDGTVNVGALDDTVALAESCVVSATGVTDIVVSGGSAVLATADGVIVEDVSACFDAAGFCEGETTVDLSKGIINMPCLNVDDEYFDVEMSQRGNSSNWKVTGLKNNKEKHKYGHEDEQEDEEVEEEEESDSEEDSDDTSEQDAV